MKTYLAVDIGASSGRHIFGWLEDGKLKLKEMGNEKATVYFSAHYTEFQCFK